MTARSNMLKRGSMMLIMSLWLSPSQLWAEPAKMWSDHELRTACIEQLRPIVQAQLVSPDSEERYSALKMYAVTLLDDGFPVDHPRSYLIYASPEYALSAASGFLLGGTMGVLGKFSPESFSEISLGFETLLGDRTDVFALKNASALYAIGKEAYLRNHERYRRLKNGPRLASNRDIVGFYWDAHFIQYLFLANELRDAVSLSASKPKKAPIQADGRRLSAVNGSQSAAQSALKKAYLKAQESLQTKKERVLGPADFRTYANEVRQAVDGGRVAKGVSHEFEQHRTRLDGLMRRFQERLNGICGPRNSLKSP